MSLDEKYEQKRGIEYSSPYEELEEETPISSSPYEESEEETPISSSSYEELEEETPISSSPYEESEEETPISRIMEEESSRERKTNNFPSVELEEETYIEKEIPRKKSKINIELDIEDIVRNIVNQTMGDAETFVEISKGKIAELTLEAARAKKHNDKQEQFLQKIEETIKRLEGRDSIFLKKIKESNLLEKISENMQNNFENTMKISLEKHQKNILKIQQNNKETLEKLSDDFSKNILEHQNKIINRMYLKEYMLFIGIAILTVAIIFTSFKIVSIKNDYENIHQNYAEILQQIDNSKTLR